MTSGFNPDRIVNFKTERVLFENLLGFNTDERVWLIEERRSGFGKTSLMGILRHQCIQSRIPVSLVMLDDAQIASPYYLVKSMVSNLSNQITFSTFSKVENALQANDSGLAISLLRSSMFRGEVNVTRIESGATGNQVASFIYNDHRSIISDNLTDFQSFGVISPEQTQYLHKMAIDSFVDDLVNYLKRSKKRIVCLFDSYEKSNPTIQNWIVQEFIRKLLFKSNRSLKRVLVVFAGQSTPSLEHEYPVERCDQIVHKILNLTHWSKDDIKDLLKIHDMEDLTEPLCLLFDGNPSPLHIVRVVESLKAAKMEQLKHDVNN